LQEAQSYNFINLKQRIS